MTSLPLFAPSTTTADTSLGRREHLTFKGNRGRGRHAWLRLTPAYSVGLVEQLVTAHTGTARILDPFCGTGTTALVCAQHRTPCDTVDINPFLIWLANAKCSTYTTTAIDEARHLLREATTGKPPSLQHLWVPPIQDITKWWDKDTLHHLAAVLAHITAAEPSQPARDLLSVAFCRAAIQLAAVSFAHQSMSFKKGVATAGLFPTNRGTIARERLHSAFEEVAASVVDELEPGLASAIHGDARNLDTILQRGKYAAVITSPPYPNRMSYIRELRPYMYWLGYLETGRQAGELDWLAIGGTWGCATSNLAKWSPDPAIEIPEPSLLETIAQIRRHSHVLATYVHKYFEDTVHHVRSLRPVLQPGASVDYVVGNSRFYDAMLHTERLYAAIFAANGFRDVHVQTIRKRSSKKELFEFVVSAIRT
jgi:hypothetical protein